MSGFALSGLACAMRRLDNAICSLEAYCALPVGLAGRERLVADAYRELLAARGEVTAVFQLIEMQHELEAAPTERPAALRLVK